MVERQLPRERALLHQQHPAARRRHASRRLPRGADPHRQHLRRRQSGIAKKEKVALTGDDTREGLTCVLSVKVPDPKFSTQTKDKLVSSEVRPVVESVVGRRLCRTGSRSIPAKRSIIVQQGRRGGRRARGGAQGARADAAQGRARHRLAARQARRLPGARSRQVRAVHRRGRFAPAARPSRAATAHSRRCCRLRGKILNVERARFDKMLSRPGDRHADHRARHRHRPRRLRPRQAALPQDHHHDRRRRRRRAYPHAAADLLLPADAGADRARAISTSPSRRSTR